MCNGSPSVEFGSIITFADSFNKIQFINPLLPTLSDSSTTTTRCRRCLSGGCPFSSEPGPSSKAICHHCLSEVDPSSLGRISSKARCHHYPYQACPSSIAKYHRCPSLVDPSSTARYHHCPSQVRPSSRARLSSRARYHRCPSLALSSQGAFPGLHALKIISVEISETGTRRL